METWKKDVEAVIKKWQSKGPPAHILEGGRAREQPGFSHNAHISYERADRKNKRSARSLRQERAKEREVMPFCNCITMHNTNFKSRVWVRAHFIREHLM